ncbi:Uncharacterised protein [Yersinia frederiksenii]|nr:Uncharacterised protein [Yersinia frederiksenii]
MKLKIIIIAITAALSLSNMAHAVSQEDKNKMMSLLKDSEPYIVGKGKSAFEVCQDMANDMVGRYGAKLSKIGKSPNDIRESTLGICLNAITSVENYQSQDEVEMWKVSALKNIDQELHGDTRTPSPRDFLIESVDKSAKVARALYFMMEVSRNYNIK